MFRTLEWLLRLLEGLCVWYSHRKANRRADTSLIELDHREGSLGIRINSDEPFSLTASDLTRHCYLLGSTGCGKTSLILRLIEADLKAEHTAVIIDLRGDLVRGALGLCEGLDIDPNRVTLLDLRDTDVRQGFNPLAGAGEPYIRALHVLDVVAAEAASWGVQLEETCRNSLLLLAACGSPLTSLEAVFYDDQFRRRCLSKVADVAVVGFWERYDGMSPDKQQAWALPVLNKITSLLAVPTLRAVLGDAAPIDLGALLRQKGQIVLVSLAVDELHRSARMMGSLMVSAIAREMFSRVNEPERDRNPVRLYVDEFENMASDSFEGLIAEGRRFKLSLVLSHQTLSQLPNRLRSVVRNNVGVQILFQCGYEDAQIVSRELPEGVSAGSMRSLSVGQAYVMGRDGEAVLVQFAAPRRLPSPRLIDRYRERVVKPFGDLPKPVNQPAPPTDRPADLDTEDWL